MPETTLSNPIGAFGGGADGYWCRKIQLVASVALTRGALAWLDVASGVPQVGVFATDIDSGSDGSILLGVVDAAAAAGAVCTIITEGYCGYVTTDTNAAVGGIGLVVEGSAAENIATNGALGDISATVVQWVVGTFLTADVGSVGTIWVRPQFLPTGTP